MKKIFILMIFAVVLNATQSIGLMTGGPGGTYIRMGHDMSQVLINTNLRVLSSVSNGSVQNIKDLLKTENVDVVLVQSDVLQHVARRSAKDASKINYITSLYDEIIHIVVRNGIDSVEQLNGKTISVGGKNSGTEMTSKNVLQILGVNATVVNRSNDKAVDQLNNSEIDALILVGGKPLKLISSLDKTKVHLLNIKNNPILGSIYKKISLTSQDYPGYINGKINTYAVQAILACYKWNKNKIGHKVRYKKMEKFIKLFFNKIEELKTHPEKWHARWKDVNIHATVPGWERYRTSQRILDDLR